jgi:DNA mismatch endonuclease (patch repair protein)
MMSGIRGKNTKPEILIRSQLHLRGFRFRIHDSHLPGRPDIVLRKYNAVIFIHGCFWHRHKCHLFKWPQTRPEFWKQKIEKNYQNDRMAIEKLLALKWRVCIVWECALKGKKKKVLTEVIDEIVGWLNSDDEELEVFG